MKFFLTLALVAALGVAASADDDLNWTGLRASFLIGKNMSFAPFPRQLNSTQTEYVPVSSTANDCTNGGLFNGIQYIKSGDFSVGLLYDVNLIIAGIQMLIPHDLVRKPTNNVKYDNLPMYQNVTFNGQLYYVLTAYFVDPTTICTTGRTADDLDEQGTGTGLWLQNGPTPADLLALPLDRPESDDETENDNWTKNNCFLGMGYHNFYSIQQYVDTNCTEMVPIFGLYNKDTKKLHGFGFITPGTVENPRFEQPPGAAIRLILGAGNTPQCVLDLQTREGVTSMHVYFGENPWSIGCPVIESVVAYFKAASSWLSSKWGR